MSINAAIVRWYVVRKFRVMMRWAVVILARLFFEKYICWGRKRKKGHRTLEIKHQEIFE